MKFEKISFRTTADERLFLKYLQQRFPTKTDTELMHNLLAYLMRYMSFGQGPQGGKDGEGSINSLTFQDHSLHEIVSSNPKALSTDDLFMQVMQLEIDREKREEREKKMQQEEKERQQRIIPEEKVGASRQYVPSTSRYVSKSLTDQLNEMAAFLEAWNRHNWAMKGPYPFRIKW